MLVSELCRVPGSKYIPKFEKIRLEPCRDKKEEEGVWDTLGYYDPELEVVFICEDEIRKTVEKLLGSGEFLERLRIPEEHAEGYLNSVVRELVRLHEHAHAYLRTAIIEMYREYEVCDVEIKWYECREVEEPLAEFAARSVIEKFREPFITVFEEIDKNSPTYYRRWIEIADRFSLSIRMISPIVRVARSKAWKSWSEFYKELEARKRSIMIEAAFLD